MSNPVMLKAILAALAMTAVAAPTNGALSQVAGGTITATTYYVKSTWQLTTGESVESAETDLAVSANNLLVVAAPANAPTNAIGWNVYVSSATGTETKQNGSTYLSLTSSWTLPTTGLVAGASAPTTALGGGSGILLLATSPFEGGMDRNAFLEIETLPTTGTITLYGTDLAAGGPTPSPTDPSWASIGTITSASVQLQEIQLPVWLMANVTTIGTGTCTATLRGIQ
jgi:hypothetical protein